jgi:hypothetical protein
MEVIVAAAQIELRKHKAQRRLVRDLIQEGYTQHTAEQLIVKAWSGIRMEMRAIYIQMLSRSLAALIICVGAVAGAFWLVNNLGPLRQTLLGEVLVGLVSLIATYVGLKFGFRFIACLLGLAETLLTSPYDP